MNRLQAHPGESCKKEIVKESGHGDAETRLVERGQPGVGEKDHVQHQQRGTKIEQDFRRVVSPQLSKKKGRAHEVTSAWVVLGPFTKAK